MEFQTDYEIYGEILIPTENSKFFNEKELLSLDDISKCSYTQFRNIIFQGELLRLIFIIKCDNYTENNFDKLVFKIDFEGTETNNIDEDDESENENKVLSDVFTVNNNKINDINLKYEQITRKSYNKEKHIGIYEVFKQIFVPRTFIGNNLIMKLQLMIKNEPISEINKDDNIDILDYYKHSLYNTTNQYSIIKTLFKEVHVIKPVNITSMKQIDLSVETALLQLKIENIINNYIFIDNSLKKSKFLQGEIKNFKKNILGNNIIIKEIHLLDEETSLEDKQINNNNKKYFKNEHKIYFELLGANFPLILKPTEEYLLSLRVNKNSFLEYKIKENYEDEENDEELYEEEQNNIAANINTNIIKERENRKSLPVIEEIVKDPINQPKKSLVGISNINNLNLNIDNSPKVMTRLKTNSLMVKRPTKFNIAKDKTSPMMGIGNPLFTENARNIASGRKNVYTTEGIDENFDKCSSVGESVKIYLITPIILMLSSNLFYENLYMGLKVKWFNEIYKYLKIEMTIPEDIYLNEFFEIRVKIRNISSENMNLYIEMKETDLEEDHPNIENLPNVIAQTKFQNVGQFNCNEDKIVMLKFLPCKIGVTHLPNFAIIDAVSDRRFFIVHNNKIIVQPINNIKLNALNRLISTTFN